MNPELEVLREGWDDAARRDAMGFIATSRSDWTPPEFFEHGRDEVTTAIHHLATLGLLPPRHKRALDFGCGMGRTAQGLTGHFDHVDGVDSSPEMIRLAEEHREAQNLSYRVTGDDLSELAPGYDLIYTNIVLQHMPQDHQRRYVTEFLRLLDVNGVALFEIPDGPDCQHGEPFLSMFGVPRATVEEWVTTAGGVVLDVEEMSVAGPWTCLRYAASRA
jgi:trans-aconitate methyltransferase